MPDPLSILITFARPEESKAVFRRLEERRPTEVGAFPGCTARLGNVRVFCVHTGIGAGAVKHLLPALLQRWNPGMVLGAGYAGALDPALTVGDVILDDRTHGIEGPRRIVSRHDPLETVEAKAAVFRETGARAVDMETEATAACCASFGVPMMAIRSISDTAAEPLPVPFAIWYDLSRQRPRPLRLLGWLAAHPARIAPFARFVRRLSGVSEALALSVEGVVRSAGNH